MSCCDITIWSYYISILCGYYICYAKKIFYTLHYILGINDGDYDNYGYFSGGGGSSEKKREVLQNSI